MKFNPPLTLESVASLTGAIPRGEPGFLITGINEIHMVEPGDITFVDHPKYYDKALRSEATTILINKEVEVPEGKAILISEDPFRDYVLLVTRYQPFTPCTAFISPSARIGKGTIIQPGAFIGNHVTIGDHCIIHSHVSIYDHCSIGNHVIIHANSVIGADAYYFQKKNGSYRKLESCGSVTIEDHVEIGALCSVDRGVSGNTIIRCGTKLDNHVQVGHDTTIGKHCLIGAFAAIAGVTRIGDHVIVWARVAINKDLVIGEGAVILATSAVDKSLEPNKTYFGIPADEVGKKWRELAALRQLPDFMIRQQK
ncbi:MAG: UDP-3-O-(3-hydroxymyristoyl)glucosamine N-acyltransferase [Bacteroidales bacterium]|nr:UDP-3-O-(3-hydroxymyristoyl)glucosamine N-acyltransferase [Lentimicrobiaceae bacterium]MDD5694707.1 UDP-3-O-(3-hydroxymyristoyl)glucosamine N-acyltransferase [Bacteroidales bacterium]